MVYPLGDRITVIPDGEEVTESGIKLVRAWHYKTHTGTIDKVGSDKHGLKPGDRIMFDDKAVNHIESDSKEKLYLMGSSDVWGVMEDK